MFNSNLLNVFCYFIVCIQPFHAEPLELRFATDASERPFEELK